MRRRAQSPTLGPQRYRAVANGRGGWDIEPSADGDMTRAQAILTLTANVRRGQGGSAPEDLAEAALARLSPEESEAFTRAAMVHVLGEKRARSLELAAEAALEDAGDEDGDDNDDVEAPMKKKPKKSPDRERVQLSPEVEAARAAAFVGAGLEKSRTHEPIPVTPLQGASVSFDELARRHREFAGTPSRDDARRELAASHPRGEELLRLGIPDSHIAALALRGDRR